jgi:serine/threonine-protein kinase RsbW
MRALETVSVPGTTDGVHRAAQAFEQFCAAQALPSQARWRFLVALDEILSNIVRHGLQGRDGAIVLTFSLEAGILTAEVVDTAGPFNPLQAPAPDTVSPLDKRRPGGLGIALVGDLMDQVRYERRDDRNHLILIWRLRPDGADPAPARDPHAD